jgi:5'-nucleotidase
MENNIIVSNPEELQRKINIFREQGINKIHVLADFDKTLTKEFVNGKRITSIVAILRNEGYLTPDYPEKAKELHSKYYPIEIDTSIPIEEKKNVMLEWWKKHFELVIKSKLNKSDLANVIQSENIVLRKELKDFLSLANESDIPIVIISSSALGETISMFLEKENLLFDNIKIISNEFIWNNEGYAIEIKEPIIHIFNKDETIVSKFPFFDQIKDKKNVILLGDSLGDLGMIKGFEYDNLIKIGFLNENIEQSLEIYKKSFDVVILNDGDFSYINQLMEQITQ